MNIKINNKHKVGFYWLLVFLFLCLWSCSTPKKIPVKSERPIFKGTFYESVRDAELDFNSLYVRAVIEIKGGKTIRTSADIYFVKDSLIQLSIQPFLRIEVARVELSKDSVKVLDRVNEKYFSESLKRIKMEDYPELNFYTLQALFLNKVFIGDGPLSEQNFVKLKMRREDENVLLAHETKKISYHFELQEELHPKNVFLIVPSHASWLSVAYDSFMPIENTVFPRSIFLTSSLKNRAMNVKIKYSNLKIVQTKPLKVSYVPGYEEVSFENLLKF